MIDRWTRIFSRWNTPSSAATPTPYITPYNTLLLNHSQPCLTYIRHALPCCIYPVMIGGQGVFSPGTKVRSARQGASRCGVERSARILQAPRREGNKQTNKQASKQNKQTSMPPVIPLVIEYRNTTPHRSYSYHLLSYSSFCNSPHFGIIPITSLSITIITSFFCSPPPPPWKGGIRQGARQVDLRAGRIHRTQVHLTNRERVLWTDGKTTVQTRSKTQGEWPPYVLSPRYDPSSLYLYICPLLTTNTPCWPMSNTPPSWSTNDRR